MTLTDAPSMTLRTRFRRVVQVAPYETKEAEVFVEQAFAGEATPEDVMAHVNGLFVYCQAAVYQQLGLAFEQDPQTGIISEAFPGTQLVSAPAGLPAPGVARASATPAPAPAAAAPQAAPQPAPVAPAPVAPQRPSYQPTGPAPSAQPSAQDDMWSDLMTYPANWQDCRPMKASGQLKGNHPDFKSLTHQQPGTTFKVGLWAERAPAWFADPWA